MLPCSQYMCQAPQIPHNSGSAFHLATETNSLWPCIYLELCSPQGWEVVVPNLGMWPPMTS